MKIITDTGSLMPQAQAAELGIELIPLQVTVQGHNYRDYFEITSEAFIEKIKTAIPASSQPAIGDVMDIFTRVKDGLYIAMTRGLSSTYDSAAGIQQHEEFSGITIYNSKTLAGPQQYLAQLAARLVKSADKAQIIQRLDACLEQCESFLIPTDFDYLKRNGRLSAMAALMSGVLKLKPIVFHRPGMLKLEKFGVGRTWTQATDAIIDRMLEAKVDLRHKIYVCHALNLEIAEKMMARIRERMGEIETELLELTPVMITQGGPGCIAIQYILKDERP